MNLSMTIKIFLLFLVLLVVFPSCAPKRAEALSTTNDSTLLGKRQMLKDFFLCKCIDKGLSASNVLKYDHSTSVLMELAEYRPEVLSSVDSLASAVVARIPVSNLKGKRGVLLGCIEYYNGKNLQTFVTGWITKLIIGQGKLLSKGG